jgi:hypothetical protein
MKANFEKTREFTGKSQELELELLKSLRNT